MTDSPVARPTPPQELHRYTITSEGASKGYFRLVEDPDGAWVTWAEVETLLSTLARPAEPAITPSVVVDRPSQPVAAPCVLSGCQYAVARPAEEAPRRDLLDVPKFYELMHRYRHATLTEPNGVVDAYDDVKRYIRQHFASRAVEAERLRALEQKWRKSAAEWQHGIGENQNTRLLTECADELAALLALAEERYCEIAGAQL